MGMGVPYIGGSLAKGLYWNTTSKEVIYICPPKHYLIGTKGQIR